MDFRALPNETGPQFQARRDFLMLGPNRSLVALCEMYCHRTTNVPTKKLRTLKAWSGKHQWQRLALEHDQSMAYELIESQVSERKRQFQAELQEFRTFHNALGKTSINIVGKLAKSLSAWAAKQEKIEITSTQEAMEYARIMVLLDKYSEYWARSLSVSRLLNEKFDDE